MRTILIALAVAVIGALPVWAQDASTAAPSTQTEAPATSGADQNPEPVKVESAEEFATRAAVSNMFEIQSSTAALERAKSDDVKAFAQQMIDDHTKALAQLTAAAQAQDITLPGDLDEAYQAKVDALTGLEGQPFDEAYMSAQVTAHEEAVVLFDGYRLLQDETPLNLFASDKIETLKAHLEQAHQIADK